MEEREDEQADLLRYWFSREAREKWFDADPAFDAALKSRFEPLLYEAKAGRLDGWAGSPQGALALVILLDQIPRNIYRNSPQAFAADAQALAAAKAAVAQGFDRALGADERWMLYLPFMHSEDLADQERGIELFAALGLEEPLRFMKRHRDIIARFGRFPHRNEILGRPSSAEEIAFLQESGSRF